MPELAHHYYLLSKFALYGHVRLKFSSATSTTVSAIRLTSVMALRRSSQLSRRAWGFTSWYMDGRYERSSGLVPR